MHDGYFGARDLVHCDIACVVALAWGIGEEEKVATVKRWFH
jgi:hypothetical protein